MVLCIDKNDRIIRLYNEVIDREGCYNLLDKVDIWPDEKEVLISIKDNPDFDLKGSCITTEIAAAIHYGFLDIVKTRINPLNIKEILAGER